MARGRGPCRALFPVSSPSPRSPCPHGSHCPRLPRRHPGASRRLQRLRLRAGRGPGPAVPRRRGRPAPAQPPGAPGQRGQRGGGRGQRRRGAAGGLGRGGRRMGGAVAVQQQPEQQRGRGPAASPAAPRRAGPWLGPAAGVCVAGAVGNPSPAERHPELAPVPGPSHTTPGVCAERLAATSTRGTSFGHLCHQLPRAWAQLRTGLTGAAMGPCARDPLSSPSWVAGPGLDTCGPGARWGPLGMCLCSA